MSADKSGDSGGRYSDICGATTSGGDRCQLPAGGTSGTGGGRCRYHGGCSTGPEDVDAVIAAGVADHADHAHVRVLERHAVKIDDEEPAV